jgi:prepilin-type processing-associated H-X9-DG protein
MGCHAAFNALKIADAFCTSDKNARVLVVCTELCSLHFQRNSSDDNMLANALFADGSAAMMVEANPDGSLRLHLESFHNDLATGGIDDMAWTIGDLGFEMRLSSYVPDLIREGITGLTQTLLRKVSLALPDIRYFAIHPGGKKILQVIEEELQISRRDTEASHRVLRNYGNMSSPTVLFVLKEVVGSLNGSSEGQRILGLAFGPGLTLESMVLKIESH